MRRALRILLVVMILMPLTAGVLVWFMLSPRPTVVSQATLSPRDLDRARATLAANDPRRNPPGTVHDLRLSERDISLALNYLLHKTVRAGAEISVGTQAARVVVSMALPRIPVRPYLNLEARLVEDARGLPRLGELRVGSVPIPPFLAAWALETAAEQVFGAPTYRAVTADIRKLAFTPGEVGVRYRWQPENLRSIGTQLAGVNPAALEAYHARLLMLQQNGVARRGSATEALKQLFAYARERSARNDPVAENRALLLVLGAWASERGLGKLVPQAAAMPAPFNLSLGSRRDFGQHFLVSAAITAGGEANVSNAVGVFKELSDSRGGSGFSFDDLLADRAGTRFGELASASAASARRVQERISRGVTEAEIIPSALGLPAGLSDAEFRRRYSEVGSPAYRALMDDIERRLTTCSFYRG